MSIQIKTHFMDLTAAWKEQTAGNLSSWTGLFVEIMNYIQKASKLKGLEKAELAIDILVSCCEAVIDTNPAGLTDEALGVVRQVITPDGLNLLRASTTAIKGLMRQIDRDGDGNISKEELQTCFPCCFSSNTP